MTPSLPPRSHDNLYLAALVLFMCGAAAAGLVHERQRHNDFQRYITEHRCVPFATREVQFEYPGKHVTEYHCANDETVWR